MKICNKCGAQNVDNASFCGTCGNVFPKDEQIVNQPQSGVYSNQPAGDYDQPQNGAYNDQPEGDYDQPQNGVYNQNQAGAYSRPQGNPYDNMQNGGFEQTTEWWI